MPIQYEKFITRQYAHANPSWWFVFGDNMARSGLGGLARELRGLPNAIGVRTKRFPSQAPSAYFTDAEFHHWKEFIASDLRLVEEKLRTDQVVVWPVRGLGRGLSSMHIYCPNLLKYLEGEEARLITTYGQVPTDRELLEAAAHRRT